MRKLFYPRLASGNLWLNRRFCAPYLLTVIVCCSMFYNLCFVASSRGLQQVGGETTTRMLNMILGFGAITVAVFSLIFLVYSNTLLIKQRKHELGLYSVLGMQKSNIARVLLWESLYINLLGIVLGLAVGMALSKLALLVLCSAMRFDVPFGFEISPSAVWMTALLFSGIAAANLLISLLRVSLLSPIGLLRGASQGEKEPRANWPMAVLGVLALGTGYVLAIITRRPDEAITAFFIAVLLVILGTYCLFVAGSIAVLRTLKRNKRYYYQLKHFTAVSGMMYRMRQHAVGLASICILSTMVLVILSTTICMNVGVDRALLARYPFDFRVDVFVYDDRPGNLSPQEALQTVEGILEEKNVLTKSRFDYTFRSISMMNPETQTMLSWQNGKRMDNDMAVFVSLEEWSRWVQTPPALSGEEALCLSLDGSVGEGLLVGEHAFRCVEAGAMADALRQIARDYTHMGNVLVVALKDADTVRQALLSALPEGAGLAPGIWRLQFDTPRLSNEEILALRSRLRAALRGRERHSLEDGSTYIAMGAIIECRALEAGDFYGLYGGLLFIGLFLGLMFLMATAMIIYYKQISEGYEDKKRYEIMQKVGMTRQEVRRTVSSQILTVFFLPLGAAVAHLLFAFPMIRRMLKLFDLSNVSLFALCTGATVLVFAAVYALIYWLTARMYYHIVEA